MKNILKSLAVIVAVAGVAGGITYAYFSDTETSNANTFSAGTLDLNLDGGNTNVVKFNVSNMKPGDQPTAGYKVKNVGTVNGFLDLENVSVADQENVCTEPEVEAGDTPSSSQGELSSVVNVRLFVDNGCDGWISTGDNVFYNGKVKNLPSNFELNEPLNTGSQKCVQALFDWWSTANDNLAQSDSMTLNFGFELGQTAGQ